MKKASLSTILITVLGFAAAQFFPWWSIAIIAALVIAFLGTKPLGAFAAGFAGASFLWGGMVWWQTAANQSQLAGMMGQVMGGLKPANLSYIVTLLGGTAAGLGALAGAYGRRLFIADLEA